MKSVFLMVSIVSCAFAVCCRADVKAPLIHMGFDDPGQDRASRAFKGLLDYVDGASGKALRFDGYTTEVELSGGSTEVLKDALTVSAWVAPQEYSLNLSAIVNQQQDFNKGYFLGINHVGQLVGAVSVAGKWQTCMSKDALPLLRWSNVAMVYDAARGIHLYIDGKKAGETLCQGDVVNAKGARISIGRTQTKMTPAETERDISKNVRWWTRFDGLIDEVKMWDIAMADDAVAKEYAKIKIANMQPLQFRRMPSGDDKPRPFGAYYTRLEYSPGWDAQWQGSDLPDVVVRFDDSPVKLVFWRGTGYIPAMVTENGIWMSDQSGENFEGEEGCREAMGDKQCRYSHVRIIENTPARAVIHWRCALTAISHKISYEDETHAGDWMDEYWTAYPDGVAVRKQVLNSRFRNKWGYQFQETIFFNQPGSKPQDTVEYEAITLMDMNGGKKTYSWKDGVPKTFDAPRYKPVQMINTKSKYRPFSIHHPERWIKPFAFGMVEGYSPFPCWNHWPVCLVPSDGRRAVAPDKPSHSSLTGVNGGKEKWIRFPDGSIRLRHLYGMTTEPIDTLLPLARSWNNPPKVESVSPSYAYEGYDQYQRAYVFERGDGAEGPLAFTLAASEQSPVVNVPVVIRNWGAAQASIEVNGEAMKEGSGFSQGLIRTLESDDRVIWIETRSTSTVKVEIQ